MIVDREREIRAFVKQEYWTIDVSFNAKKPPVLGARLAKIENADSLAPPRPADESKTPYKPYIGDEAASRRILDDLIDATYKVQIGHDSGKAP